MLVYQRVSYIVNIFDISIDAVTLGLSPRPRCCRARRLFAVGARRHGSLAAAAAALGAWLGRQWDFLGMDGIDGLYDRHVHICVYIYMCVCVY